MFHIYLLSFISYLSQISEQQLACKLLDETTFSLKIPKKTLLSIYLQNVHFCFYFIFAEKNLISDSVMLLFSWWEIKTSIHTAFFSISLNQYD